MRSTLALVSAGALALLAAIALRGAFQNIDAGLSADAEIILFGVSVLLTVANLFVAFNEESNHVAQQN